MLTKQNNKLQSCSCCNNKIQVFAKRRRSTTRKRSRLAAYDPTKTLTIRKRFEADVNRRFNKLLKAIDTEVVEKDGFSLEGLSDIQANVKSGEGRFEFTRADEKVDAFMDWLEDEAQDGILEIQRGTPIESAAQDAWCNVYIDTSYQRGIRQAGEEIRRGGIQIDRTFIADAFNRHIHADRAGLIYTRTLEELKNVTDDMASSIRDELTRGMLEGKGPLDMAAKIKDRVKKVGLYRARLIARTETIAAHAEATLNTYQEAGLEGVHVLAEWNTAGEGVKVCEICLDLERQTRANPIPIAEARGMIPAHPNCRCSWIPLVKDTSEDRI